MRRVTEMFLFRRKKQRLLNEAKRMMASRFPYTMATGTAFTAKEELNE